jgi:REP element-mobilizing transposase RayT
LDKGRGNCYLRRADIAELVEGAVRSYHVRYYDLRAWVVMPNHLHLLFTVGTIPMSRILAQLKEYTAREANKLLRRRGEFWAPDYWDTFMRDGEHELRSRRYIENNPTKARLVLDPKLWSRTSARFRDDNGQLRL